MSVSGVSVTRDKMPHKLRVSDIATLASYASFQEKKLHNFQPSIELCKIWKKDQNKIKNLIHENHLNSKTPQTEIG